MLGNTLETRGTYWEPNGNPLRTWRELSENTFGNQGKMKKNPPTPQLEKARHLGCMLGPSHGLHEISLHKRVRHLFLSQANTVCKEHPTSIINWGYLFCFILISWGCLISPTSFFCIEPIWLAHRDKKKLKLWSLPRIEDSMERRSASPFGFSCLLAHVFGPCMVLHKTTQHGSTFFLILQKNLAMFF
jgi:hypothetical protein